MIRRLPSVIAMIVTAGAAGLLTGTASHAAQATLGCPGTVQAGQQLATEITVDVGTTPLGAYSLTVTYDPTVLTIASVAGGNSPEFAGAPTTNPGSFTSGSTNISAFQTSSLTGPTGVVSITRVTFNAVGTASTTTSVGLTVRSLFDTNSNPISATTTGCMVMVTGGTATTTSSTATTMIPTTTTSSSTTTSVPSTSSTSTSASTTRPPTTTSSATTSTTRAPTTTSSTTTTRAPTTTTRPTTTSTGSTSTTTSTATTRPTTASTSSTTTTLPTGIPPALSAIDSAIGALIGEVDAGEISPHLRDMLLRQLQRARRDVERAGAFLAQHRRRQADAALEHAARWVISFKFRVGSLAGRRGGADRGKLLPMANAILSALRNVQRSI